MKLELQIDEKKNKIFAPLKDKWLVKTPEELVRQRYIQKLVNNYGFSLNQMKQELTVAEGNSRGTGRAQADIVIWKNQEEVEKENPIIIIECKADNITILSDDYWQGFHYARYCSSPFLVTTNIKETKVFKVNTKFPKDLGEEIIDIPDAKSVNNEKKIKELLKQTKAFTRDEFSKVLFQCHNIIRNNDKLSPEAAFDEISKVLFIKIRYERDNNEAQIFSKQRFIENRKNYTKLNEEMGVKNANPFYQQLFEKTKQEFKDDDLFATNETLKIRENSFESIVEKLEKYNLSTTSDDVKGIAFEQFLGKTFRGELGQFFTPRTVVDFMVEVLDPQEGETICDPCCGSGGFLIKAFEFVRAKIENEIHEQKESIKKEYFTDDFDKLSEKKKAEIEEKVNELFIKLNQELDINNEKSRLRVLSYDCIFGTDANPRMSRTAKMNMIMHGDGHGGVHHNDGLLNVNGIFENRFDVILTNPPFGARVEKTAKITEADKYTDLERIEKYKERYDTPKNPAYSNALKQVNDNVGKKLLSLYQTGSMSTLTEVLFIERCLNLLKPGGRMGIVLPEGVLNNSNLQRVREFVESRAKITLITSIPQDVFIASGATVKPSLLFFKKFNEQEAKDWKTISLRAKKQIEEEYASQISPLKSKLALRGKDAPSAEDKKKLRKELKEIEQKMIEEIRAQIKSEFDYEIPIAEVEKAGISTTGAQIENELKPLAKEFTDYRIEKNLWDKKFNSINYELDSDGNFYRIPIVNAIAQEPEVFYGK
ncbi:type I restriction enzyme M protein [Cellulophaga sp. RHA_52]|uniref:N-6 DNA methylase n=1 Tax=Cellulophaga sp. RHA_52 TaxID=1250036 RepID=UPI00119A6BA6|nr:N-6 DNA methylase [Cellulophaga sp. RHA_52]TVZ07843.1 type I restriction enzyme M protein [Cellulophaga sp. RHA_52]